MMQYNVSAIFHWHFLQVFTLNTSQPVYGLQFISKRFIFNALEIPQCCTKIWTSIVLHSSPKCNNKWIILMALCKTAVSPVQMHWRYCSVALNHRCYLIVLTYLEDGVYEEPDSCKDIMSQYQSGRHLGRVGALSLTQVHLRYLQQAPNNSAGIQHK